jgi:FkbM family methyltransferase
MKLLKNTLAGLKYNHWTKLEAFAYFLKGVAREIHFAPDFFLAFYNKMDYRAFRKWRVQNGNESYLNIKGVKLVGICRYNFDDIFSIFCFFNDNYEKSLVDYLDQYMPEGPYCYRDGDFDVTIKEGDVVMDVGASVGEFCAYASFKGAISYAFEPVAERFEQLCKTATLNDGKIIPVQKGLGMTIGDALISTGDNMSPSLVFREGNATEKIVMTTLDKFVEENKLDKIDFIKADIEGAERDMLRGATNVLKTYAPKLAICTYHLPDDPEVLEKIILEANPNYKVVQLKHKLMAAVVIKP